MASRRLPSADVLDFIAELGRVAERLEAIDAKLRENAERFPTPAEKPGPVEAYVTSADGKRVEREI